MSEVSWRLPAPAGLLLDRSKEISFSFAGRSYMGYAGDTIASALAANGVKVLSRSFKYHRPRGILTMAGQDANTLVQVGSEPNVLADRRKISEGMVVDGQNYKGSLEKDRYAWLGKMARFMPAGFYYRAFFKPKGVFEKYWEPVIRGVAGLGKVDFNTPHRYYDKAYCFYDVAVIGSGPAGMAAALEAASQGAKVVLVEENPVLGGSLTYARFESDSARADKLRGELSQAVEAEPNIDVMCDSVCNGWFGDNYLPVIRGDRMYKARAHAVVFATGSLEQQALFHNNDLPGVMMGSAAQRLIKLYGAKPGRRAVVLAGNDEGYGVALDLFEAGIEIAGIVDLRGTASKDGRAAEIVRRGVRIYQGYALAEALAGPGNKSVVGAKVGRISHEGEIDSTQEKLDCDCLCMSVGFTPTYQLLLQAGGKLGYDDDTAMFSITGLGEAQQMAGSVTGSFDLDAAIAEGRRAGWRAAKAAGHSTGSREPEVPDDRGCAGINHPWPIFPHPKHKEFVDYDEDLQIRDILSSCAEGYYELELVKRFSTVGMGPSQGRHSALAAARLVAKYNGRSVAETGVTTARPPFTAEKVGVVAGRGFEPERFTAMHHRHLEAGAQMMTAGLWWRPAYYGPEHQRAQCIRDEVLAVRKNVAVIDVSTLGGLEIRGPDAPEFMNRVYTFAYLKQPVGRSRYVLMTNEAGTVIDDGVACRFRDDHYYVTATTGGVDRVYQSLLWWNAQWRLDVDISNVTAAYSGVNIAGPNSRAILAKLTDDVDLGPEAFPYMGLREGHVAGIPARLLRVGFVGELGFEIHVPSSHGEALWDALLEAGKGAGIRPFGVEAQRVLRLEKGHIIVSQDTDAMSYPHEVGMEWAIAGKKPFFVGGRSIQLRERNPSRRKLVGFTLAGGGEMPGESNLILRDGDKIAGFVTSVAHSPTLEKTIGLAYAHVDDAKVGNRIDIKLDSGRVIQAEVAHHPFYDPENQRQEM